MKGGAHMENTEKDIVTFTDEDGKNFDLEVVDYFNYNGQEYAVLMDPLPEGGEIPETKDPADVYIMKLNAVGEDEEEFVPVEDEKLFQELCEVVNARFDLGEDGCECDCCEAHCDEKE